MKPSLKKTMETLLKERTFSFSRLSVIETCLLQYFFKYVLQLNDGETMPLQFGKAVHKAIEEYANGDDDKTALLKGLKEVGFYPLPFDEYIRVFANAKRYIERGASKKESVNLEVHFVLELDERIKLQGFVDVLKSYNGVYHFTDWKTNRVPYNVLDSYQLALYALAFKELYGANYVSGELIFLRFKYRNRKHQNFEARHMEEAKTWATYHAKRALQSIENALNGQPLEEAFPKRLTSKCSYCPFADLCIEVENTGLERIL